MKSRTVNILREVGVAVLLPASLFVIYVAATQVVSASEDEILYTTTNEGTSTESQFEVSASEFFVEFEVQEQAVLEYKLTNRLPEELNFRLQLSEPEQIDQLASRDLKLEIEIADSRVELANGIDIKVSGASEKTVKLILTPLKQQDYNLDLGLKLVQEESARKLSESEYQLRIVVDSKLVSSHKVDYAELGAVVFIALGVIILSVLIINRTSNNGPQSN